MITKKRLEKEVNKGLSYRSIARIFKVSPSTLRYYLDKYDLKTFGNQEQKTPDYVKDLPGIVKKSKTMSDVLRAIGLQIRPGNYDTINKWCIKLKISTDHFLGKGHGRTKSTKKKTDKELFINPCYVNRKVVKKRLIEKELIPYKCSICLLDPVWEEKELILVLDHKNGKRFDNRIKNLRFLCPNCNSQQETFCRK